MERGDGQVLDGTSDEYWYDALGRRVLVRSLREDLCKSPSGCESAIERTVWAGDQVLYEIRGPGGSSDDLDETNPSGTQYGTVGYTHAGGIDQRGVYRAATTRTGALHTCEGQGGCINVLWPAPRRGAYHQGDASGGDWVGSLIPGMQDASGLLYRRNRYYNPQTGQFTQTDPIGLAGGLNTYGFAAGDPVSYADPYGLAAEGDCDNPKGRSEKIVCKTASKLKPWKPFLDGATVALLTFAPTGIGQLGAVFQGTKQMAIAGARGLSLIPPLKSSIASTFRGGEYIAAKLEQPLTLFRVFDATNASAAGRWFTNVAPASSSEAIENLVLYNNAATHIATVTLPKGTTVYQGVIAKSPTEALQIFVPHGPAVGYVQSVTTLIP